ncbi:polyprenyl synthetase family protein [Maritalea porphyrae]|uniref:polyprenyl synthetase family protein n=1 Tax=Maritalea porphyrae TaxID=880732 RepID=UPI0022AE65A9|nr:polyprenyl synthetase family protein [Maritalea porphyrae]MCZ4271351.1 polyprenyl synthetase family protein [Maritalea porphyrae]
MSTMEATAAKIIDQPIVDQLVAHTSVEMEEVNKLLLSRVGSHVQMVPDIANYLISAGGKRLRPMLTVAAAMMFEPKGQQHISYAAAVEFMHTATLLHDDVVDESDKRRGQDAPRKIWGNAASVLVGDFLLGQAFMMMVDAGNLEALGILSRSAAIIAEGEVFQLTNAKDANTKVDDYFEVIKAKTAALFEAATEVGAMAGGANLADRSALKTYGAQLGIAFQLVDDALDYGGVSGTIGKNVGDDLREGKMTLPVLHALQNASTTDAQFIRENLGNQDASEKAVSRVVGILQSCGALQTTLDRAYEHADLAKAALAPLAERNGARILIEIADYCVERAA